MANPSVRLSLLVLFLTLCVAPLSGHQEPRSEPTVQPFAAAVSAVIVDVVVRDRQGKPVMDLTNEDFELFEDGVRQEIADFTVIRLGDPPSQGRTTHGDATVSRTTVSFTAVWSSTTSPPRSGRGQSQPRRRWWIHFGRTSSRASS